MTVPVGTNFVSSVIKIKTPQKRTCVKSYRYVSHHTPKVVIRWSWSPMRDLTTCNKVRSERKIRYHAPLRNLCFYWTWISCSSIFFEDMLHFSVVFPIVFLTNLVRCYERCVAPQKNSRFYTSAGDLVYKNSLGRRFLQPSLLAILTAIMILLF